MIGYRTPPIDYTLCVCGVRSNYPLGNDLGDLPCTLWIWYIHIMRTCSKCKRQYPTTSQYWKLRKGKYPYRACKSCEREYNNKWFRESEQRYKFQAVHAYGSHCECCRETHIQFLTFDHISGGGNEHRRSNAGARKNLAKWLVQNNYPAGFRILCWNCHMSMNGGRTCPHKYIQ